MIKAGIKGFRRVMDDATKGVTRAVSHLTSMDGQTSPGLVFNFFHRVADDWDEPCLYEGVPVARVLIVDDDETTRLMLGAAAKGVGHTVIFATNGNMALNMFRSEMPDVVVMDIAMPDRNGLLTTRDLRAEFPQAKIIVISGENAEQLSYGLEYGAVATMTKPIAPAELQTVLQDVLQSSATVPAPGRAP